MDTPDPAIEALRGVLHGRKDIRLALLFGSRARGRARPDSDADVAVLGRRGGGRGLDLLELAADLSAAAHIEVDVVSLEDPGYPLLNALLRDSIVLHEGDEAPRPPGARMPSWMRSWTVRVTKECATLISSALPRAPWLT